MSEQIDNKLPFLLLGALPILLLLGAETALFSLQHSLTTFIAYFAFAVLTSQLVLQVVFTKGEICPGQRFRLVHANLFFVIYWLGLFTLGAMAEQRYVPLALLIAAGLLLLATVWQQPKDDERLRRGILLFGTISGVLGVLCALAILFSLPLQNGLIYSPFSQVLLGLILAHWQLRLSRNRLQGFLALLPRLMLLALLMNALYSLLVLLLLHWQLATVTISTLQFAVYFALHLGLALVLFAIIWWRTVVDLKWLSLLLGLSLALPFSLL